MGWFNDAWIGLKHNSVGKNLRFGNIYLEVPCLTPLGSNIKILVVSWVRALGQVRVPPSLVERCLDYGGSFSFPSILSFTPKTEHWILSRSCIYLFNDAWIMEDHSQLPILLSFTPKTEHWILLWYFFFNIQWWVDSAEKSEKSRRTTCCREAMHVTETRECEKLHGLDFGKVCFLPFFISSVPSAS